MLTIPELATQFVEKTISKTNGDAARTIFFVGSPQVGKTTLIYALFDKNDTPRETIVLEYSFGRKSNQKFEKTICHIWEYGGKLDMLKNAITSVNITGKYYYCIVIDLSKIKTIWNILETCIQAIKDANSEDYPPEIIILCGKYDIFKNYEAEIKKVICSTIRSVGVLLNAHVIYYSSKDTQLARRGKDVLHGMSFGNGVPVKDKITNFQKPLYIIKTSDSWESIGVPVSNLEQIKARHLSRIPSSEVGVASIGVAVAPQRAHPEPALDSKVCHKYDEIRNTNAIDISLSDYLISLQN